MEITHLDSLSSLLSFQWDPCSVPALGDKSMALYSVEQSAEHLETISAAVKQCVGKLDPEDVKTKSILQKLLNDANFMLCIFP